MSSDSLAKTADNTLETASNDKRNVVSGNSPLPTVLHRHNWPRVIKVSRELLRVLKQTSAAIPPNPAESRSDSLQFSAVKHQTGHLWTSLYHLLTIDPRTDGCHCRDDDATADMFWLCYQEHNDLRSAALRLWKFYSRTITPRQNAFALWPTYSDVELNEFEAAIDALENAVKVIGQTIPYDPELMEALAKDFQRDWQKLETLRREVYRHLMPTVWSELLEAERAVDAEQMKAIEMRADREWSYAMGVPAITSFENLDIIMATVSKDGYPATDAGLRAWTIGRLAQKQSMPKPAASDETSIPRILQFHETLVDAFVIAADTAVWLAQFNCGWTDPNAEAVKRLHKLTLAANRLSDAKRDVGVFRKARIATKAAGEAAIFKGPDGIPYASYHDAALGLVTVLLDYSALPHFDEAGHVESYSVTSDPQSASPNDILRSRDWFDKVKDEYLAGMASEAAAVDTKRMESNSATTLVIGRQFFADRFCELAEQFTDPNTTVTDKGAIFKGQNLQNAAGELFIDAVDRGYLESIPRGKEWLATYRDALARYVLKERVGFSNGECIAYGAEADAVYFPCPQNLFLEVAGGPSKIDIFNDNGVLRVTGASPPKGLLPDVFPSIFPTSNYAVLLIRATGDEAADYKRLVQMELLDRCAITCRLLAEMLEQEQTAESDGSKVNDIADKLPRPKQYLSSWREILDALDLTNNEESKNKVRRLVESHSGPIVLPSRGGQPKVEKTKLIEWWNDLENRFTESVQRISDRDATVAETHNYGRDGTAAPNIGGSIKRRRTSGKVRKGPKTS